MCYLGMGTATLHRVAMSSRGGGSLTAPRRCALCAQSDAMPLQPIGLLRTSGIMRTRHCYSVHCVALGIVDVASLAYSTLPDCRRSMRDWRFTPAQPHHSGLTSLSSTLSTSLSRWSSFPGRMGPAATAKSTREAEFGERRQILNA